MNINQIYNSIFKKINMALKHNWIVLGLFFPNISFPIDRISTLQCHEPQMIQLINHAKKELNNRLYLTVATVDHHAEPWNTPVYSAFDLKYNFYWMSSSSSQHSKNIRLNSKTFVVIYNSTVPEGTGFGVYLRGNSYELNSMDRIEINHGIAVLGARIHRANLPSANDYLPPFPRRLYKFIPKQAWVNTIINIQGKKVDQRLEITECLLKNQMIK